MTLQPHDPQNHIPFLRSLDLFKDFTAEEMASLLPLIQVAIFKKGDWIIKEGESDQNLYLIKSGAAEILKKGEDSNHFFHLGIVRSKEWMGEMAHLEREKRYASVRAIEETEALILPLPHLQTLSPQRSIYVKIVARLANKISSHLRKTDDTLVYLLQDKLKTLQTNNQISMTIVHSFILLAFWFNSIKLIQIFPSEIKRIDPIITSILILVISFSAVYVVRKSGYPLCFYGLTFNRWLSNIRDAVLYTIPLLLGAVLLKWLLIMHVSTFSELPLFASPYSYLSPKQFISFSIAYLLVVPIQEFVARGVLQSCFRNFFQGPHRVFFAILTANLLFEILHTVKSFWLAIATFFLGFFWGMLYERQKSILGVCVSHSLTGAWAFLILDYQTIFDLAN